MESHWYYVPATFSRLNCMTFVIFGYQSLGKRYLVLCRYINYTTIGYLVARCSVIIHLLR